jgi:hypothetical protein
MEPAFAELAKGNFAPGLKLLDQDDQWYDDNNDLQGPFRLGFPGAQGWGEDLLVASLLRRSGEEKHPIKVFSKYWQVCSILNQDPALDPAESKNDKDGRPPLAILRHALSGNLLDKSFVSLRSSADSAKPSGSRPRIGMAWASITNNHRISEKSVPLKQFLDICAGIKADFVSFQRELEVADPDCLLRKFGVRTIRREVLNAESQSFLEELIDEMRQLKCLVLLFVITVTYFSWSLSSRFHLSWGDFR